MPWYGPEFKPTDEQTRFFIVPSTGAAMLLVSQIGRPNMGLTIAEAPVLVVPRELHLKVSWRGGRGQCCPSMASVLPFQRPLYGPSA